MDLEAIRWKQRFQNFNKAYQHFAQAIMDYPKLSVLEKEGLIQRFEYTFELAWKTMKDYLQEQKVEVNFPRDVIKMALRHGLIDDGELWMDMLEKRNLVAHTYDEDNFNDSINLIMQRYHVAIRDAYMFFKKCNDHE